VGVSVSVGVGEESLVDSRLYRVRCEGVKRLSVSR